MPSDTDWSTLLELRPELLTVALALITVLGLVLCLLGRRLLRSLCTLTGIAGGGGAAYALARGGAGDQMLFAWIILGAMAGLVIGWFLFRIWMGVTLALILAVAGSALALLLQDNLPPLVPDSARQLWQELRAPAAADQPSDDGEGTAEDRATGEAALRAVAEAELGLKELVQTLAAAPRERLKPVVDDEAKALRTWWRTTSAGNRSIALAAASIGGLGGLIFGLMAPHVTATLVSSLLGAVLVVTSIGLSPLPQLAPVVPRSGMARLGAVSLITVGGVLVQWTIFRKKTDK